MPNFGRCELCGSEMCPGGDCAESAPDNRGKPSPPCRRCGGKGRVEIRAGHPIPCPLCRLATEEEVNAIFCGDDEPRDPIGTVILRFNNGNPGVTVEGLGFLNKGPALKLARDIFLAFEVPVP